MVCFLRHTSRKLVVRKLKILLLLLLTIITILVTTRKNNLSKLSYLEEKTKEKVESTLKEKQPKYLIDPAEREDFSCQTANNKTIIVMVLSHYKNYQQRDLIRKTWASNKSHFLHSANEIEFENNWKVFFVLGKPDDIENKQSRITKESISYNDLIQIDLVENYDNLIFKVGAMLDWFNDVCGRAAWMVKADDDIIFNPFVFQHVFPPTFVEKSSDVALMIGTTIGILGPRQHVLRKGRWGVGNGFKPKNYPPYAQGNLYILTRRAVTRTCIAYFPRQIPDLLIEDAYLTGVLREELGIHLLDFSEFYIAHKKGFILNKYGFHTDLTKFVTRQNEEDKVQMPLTSEWRLQEFRRMTKDGSSYLQEALDIPLLHKRLDYFINTASSSDKYSYTQNKFNEEGVLWHGTKITNDRCFVIKTPWTRK